MDCLTRHHNPSSWLTDDGLGRAAPNDFIETGMPISTHNQKVDRIFLHIRLEYFSDRTAVDPHRFETGIDPVLGEMIDKSRPRPHPLRGRVVGCRDDMHDL